MKEVGAHVSGPHSTDVLEQAWATFFAKGHTVNTLGPAFRMVPAATQLWRRKVKAAAERGCVPIKLCGH